MHIGLATVVFPFFFIGATVSAYPALSFLFIGVARGAVDAGAPQD